MKRDSYHTKQKEKIMDVIQNYHHEFTIKDLYQEMNQEIGLTTIYRFVDKLVEDGSLEKFISKDNITYYQYLEQCEEENHFYLKCKVCGNMIHVDCDCIEDLSHHIWKDHQFRPSKEHIIINGTCVSCSRKEV